MVYGQFTDYTPHPDIPGAYNFGTPQGPITFGGQAAAELKARYDAANQATTVAGDNAAPGFVDPNIQANAIYAAAKANQPPASIAALPPDEAAKVASGGMSPIVANGVNTGLVNGPGGVYERTAGTKGVSKADLLKRNADAVLTPTAESKTVTGGFEESQQYKDDMAKADALQAKAIEEKRNADITAQEQGRYEAGEQFKADTAARDQALDYQTQVQAHVNNAQAVRDQAVKDYSGTKIDPNQIFHGDGGAIKGIVAALAAGAGAYGAAINHTQNFAQQAIDAAINRNIAGQEADLRTKGNTVDNAVGDLVRRGMSLQQAKNTLATIQTNWAAEKLALAQGASGTDQINANADQLQAALLQKNTQRNEDYHQKSLGTAQQTVQSQFAHTVAGTAGGLRRLSGQQGLAIAGQAADITGKQITNVKGEAEAAKTEAETNKLRGEGAKVKPNTGEIDVKASLNDLGNWETKFKAGKSPVILFDRVPGVPEGVARAFAGDEEKQLYTDAEAIAPSLAMALAGTRRPSPALTAKIQGELQHGGSRAQEMINAIKSRLDTRQKAEQQKGGAAPTAADALSAAIDEQAPE